MSSIDNTHSNEAGVVNIPQKVKQQHSKAVAAMERGNFDAAVALFFYCVQQCPEFSAARRNLRMAEIALFKQKNPGKKAASAHQMATLSAMFTQMKIPGLLKSGKVAEALAIVEDLLKKDPLNIGFLKTYVKVATEAGQGDAAVMTLELVKEHIDVKDMGPLVEILGRLLFDLKRYKEAGPYIEQAARLKPNNSELMKMTKDCATLATINRGWDASEKDKDWRTALGNKEEAVKLEQQNKMVKTADDADALIAETMQKLEAEPRNMNYYFALASLYSQQKRFDEALAVLNQAREFAPADPELDRRTAALTIEKFNFEIAQLQAAGDEQGVADKSTERDQFEFDDISARVGRYPNDYHLRYELGMQYHKHGYYDEAIGQLQLAIKSPKDKVSALYHLGLCFRHKGLLDMAVSQLEQAIELLPSMNDEKMNIYYLMGEISEEEGNIDEAAKYFKEIYRVDVRFRDISQRIDKIYAAQRAAKEKAN
jgi:tetratricopeptide (TPR) repeat protein